ncbi:hypothetical protein BDV25DRAFT_137246 [Aspergillus avenaceus]|uniref:Membrane anchor Opy2 N-terminal domain-containing protein n=1 Tax=Aspergillus avenaceus TaxID=36643 RepID=A0A5N6U3S4_ASPAV|nr:hypothetical protein BDV25DRAFT_137246 [Aspergillus avenaceus]
MSLYSTDPSFSSSVLTARSIFKRCVKCDTAAPACPSCDTGSVCTMISQSCDQCATTKCVKTTSSSSQNSSGGGSNVGAIAGGVVGGVLAVAIITFLVWWFFVRKKRQEYAQQGGSEGEKSSTTTDPRQARKSTNSIASTVLTRASNVIQIAYIPGVTNRSPPETPLVPPVPPLPGAAPDQHFFMPGDLRDSTWSDTSRAHRSIAPSLRSSVATTIYRDNAIVSATPAQQAMRTRAAVVSIHNNGNPPGSNSLAPPDAPAVPTITHAQLARAGVTEPNSNSSIVARTVTAKPVMVKGSIKKKNIKGNNNNTNNNQNTTSPAIKTIEEQSESSNSAPSSMKQPPMPTSGFDANSSDEEDSASNNDKRTEIAKSGSPKSPTVIEDSPAVEQSPFKDQPTTQTDRASARLSSRLENEDGSRSNRSSRIPPERTESPFSDANEVK